MTTKNETSINIDRRDMETGTVSINSRAVDDALPFLQSYDHAILLDEDAEKALVKKIDWMVLPFLSVVAFLQFLDKSLLSYANVMGLEKDTHSDAAQFSYLATAFYVAYFIFELPSGYLIQRLPLAKYLGANVIVWGIILSINSGSTNYGSIVALRALLGAFESVVTPGLILITTMWYKKSEQPLRIGIWFCSTGLARAAGGLGSFAFQHYHGRVFKSWQIMFLVCGLVTIVAGIAVILFFPDNPMKSRLSATEKYIAVERLRTNMTGIENKHFRPRQMLEAFTDLRVIMLALLFTIASEVNGAMGNYQATLINGFGYTSEQSALLSIALGFVGLAAALILSYLAGRYNNRTLILIFLYPLGVAGCGLMAYSHQKHAELGGIFMLELVSSTPLIYSLAAANCSGHTKKITVNAMMLMSFSIGNIIGPLTFTGATAPAYIPAKIAMMAAFAAAEVIVIILRILLQLENKRRRNSGVAGHVKDSEYMNLTDKENPEFKYSL
ncbi:allantoin permease [Hyaloscypha variabilis F]|uniref:Allantoin permease n=1 Tax=Hyaloscypha variabilis (strain UAMH 11265 / GT02V1 / F) TaxID=1149755 RepID=A0A2J6RWM2_HYAVF|nr:allantoin permease [Hyaloscypha variabilis F]